ncbi:DUF2147 domain-containing protein [Marivirga harenae]|uniref:DUF2147 domain-containing protein n=1 Tax=Marivirga harenae TaxID=2010992 RepID=UPI0026DFFDC0|nr:DUF2147 domain-containing protein [Marivirga harenae]WKV12583.1 DUF2147 domain-containing protein [Marivirga harenae]|tara:strand:+ start:53542 stop:54006 length:465 start_codon:yes stop_codon:yes gene_type:complete
MKKLIIVLLAVSAIYVSSPIQAQEAKDGDALIGVWEPSHGKARIKIDKIADKYYGRIVWLKEPNDPETGEPKLDKNNPDESMHSAPLRGYRMLKDFEYQGDGVWTEGTIYDPENGNTYSSEITLKDDNTLDIRGYIGMKTFGRTDVWKRLIIKK